MMKEADPRASQGLLGDEGEEEEEEEEAEEVLVCMLFKASSWLKFLGSVCYLDIRLPVVLPLV